MISSEKLNPLIEAKLIVSSGFKVFNCSRKIVSVLALLIKLGFCSAGDSASGLSCRLIVESEEKANTPPAFL